MFGYPSLLSFQQQSSDAHITRTLAARNKTPFARQWWLAAQLGFRRPARKLDWTHLLLQEPSVATSLARVARALPRLCAISPLFFFAFFLSVSCVWPSSLHSTACFLLSWSNPADAAREAVVFGQHRSRAQQYPSLSGVCDTHKAQHQPNFGSRKQDRDRSGC